MKTKNSITLILFISFFSAFGQTTIESKNVDPTGTYKLESKTSKKNGEIYGYFGQIQIRKLNEEKIILAFEFCIGAPSYNSGSFIDTLDFKVNKSLYKPGAQVDASCEITFDFTNKGISVDEKADDYNFGCGFGHGVIAYGFFKKISSKEPIIVYK